LLLSQVDIDVLEKFKYDIKFTGPIEYRNDKINYGEKYGIKISKIAKIRISSKELREDLINLGCMPQKTFLIKFPYKYVPDSLLSHFIRGYFDGDGSVFIRKYKRKDGKIRGFAQITSTDNIVQEIKSYLVNKYNFNKNSICISPHSKSKGISILTIASFPAMKLFREFLYKDATNFLSRKKILFDSLYLESDLCHTK
jgi:hypothetical protein